MHKSRRLRTQIETQNNRWKNRVNDRRDEAPELTAVYCLPSPRQCLACGQSIEERAKKGFGPLLSTSPTRCARTYRWAMIGKSNSRRGWIAFLFFSLFRPKLTYVRVRTYGTDLPVGSASCRLSAHAMLHPWNEARYSRRHRQRNAPSSRNREYPAWLGVFDEHFGTYPNFTLLGKGCDIYLWSASVLKGSSGNVKVAFRRYRPFIVFLLPFSIYIRVDIISNKYRSCHLFCFL